mmetsp:Transcript_41557/g.97482  ORF Transcript_41557/g.97482 Transcript_41557/m.97482 type:complete len:106 (+) Transcript_41557:215-532(+)
MAEGELKRRVTDLERDLDRANLELQARTEEVKRSIDHTVRQQLDLRNKQDQIRCKDEEIVGLESQLRELREFINLHGHSRSGNVANDAMYRRAGRGGPVTSPTDK